LCPRDARKKGRKDAQRKEKWLARFLIATHKGLAYNY